jgi:hypothetical protein
MITNYLISTKNYSFAYKMIFRIILNNEGINYNLTINVLISIVKMWLIGRFIAVYRSIRK